MGESSRDMAGAWVLPPAAAAPSRAAIEQAVARGRRLQGEALRAGFRTLLRPFAAEPERTRRPHPCC